MRFILMMTVIAVYQSVDVLPKPDRRGRAAVDYQKDLERLRLIAELRDPGLSLSAIGHLLGRRASPGMSVGEWVWPGRDLARTLVRG
jgi:DNA-binding transcriptional MerR regulator